MIGALKRNISIITVAIALTLILNASSLAQKYVSLTSKRMQDLYTKHCGSIVITFACAALDRQSPPFEDIVRMTESDKGKGVNMATLQRVLKENCDIYSKGVFFKDKRKALNAPYPMVLHVNHCADHFILLMDSRSDTNEVLIVDYPMSVGWRPLSSILPIWTGKALLLSTTEFPAPSFGFKKILSLAVFVTGILLVILAFRFRFRNKRVCGLWFLILPSPILYGSSSGAWGDSPLSIEPSSAKIEHPKILCGSQVKDTFYIHNSSKTDWIVEDIKKSCNCMNPEVSSKVIPAGGSISIITRQSSKIPTIENAMFYLRAVEKGTKRKENITFCQRVTYVKGYVFSPLHLSLKYIEGHSPENAMFYLFRGDDTSVKEEDKLITYYPKFLLKPEINRKVDKSVAFSDRPSHGVKVLPRPGLEVGAYSDYIKLSSTFSKITSKSLVLSIPVSLSVLSKYYALPSSFIHRIQHHRGQRHVVKILTRDGSSTPQISKVDNPVPDILNISIKDNIASIGVNESALSNVNLPWSNSIILYWNQNASRDKIDVALFP